MNSASASSLNVPRRRDHYDAHSIGDKEALRFVHVAGNQQHTGRVERPAQRGVGHEPHDAAVSVGSADNPVRGGDDKSTLNVNVCRTTL